MSASTASLPNGHASTPGGSLALEVASRGLRTMRGLANFAIAHAIDTLKGVVGVREANTSLRAIGETRKIITDGQRMGYEKHVIDSPGVCDSDDELRRRESELTAELEAIRERRSA